MHWFYRDVRLWIMFSIGRSAFLLTVLADNNNFAVDSEHDKTNILGKSWGFETLTPIPTQELDFVTYPYA